MFRRCRKGAVWRRLIDTSRGPPDDASEGVEVKLVAGATYLFQPYSIAYLFTY